MQMIWDFMVAGFITMLNMSITASVVIGFVFLARLCLKRAPKGFSYALWVVVLFRLLCPVSFALPFAAVGVTGVLPTAQASLSAMQYLSPSAALFGAAEDAELAESSDAEQQDTVPSEGADAVQGDTTATSQAVQAESTAGNALVTEPAQQQGLAVEEAQEIQWGAILLRSVSLFWFVGALTLLVANCSSLLRLKSQLKQAVLCQLWAEQSNICYTAHIPTAFVFGLIAPRVYLPARLSPKEQAHILLHEQTHIARGDHLWQALAFFALCLHWFNPLVWLAFYANQKDMELSCDERVLRQMGNAVKQEYAQSLLNLSARQRKPLHTVLAFGESEASARIKNALAYRKPLWCVTGAAGFVLVVVGILLLANPVSENAMQTQEGTDITAQESNLAMETLAAQTFDAPESEAEILAKRELAFAGLTEEEAQGFILRIQAMNQWLEGEWVYGNHFEKFSYPTSLYWNYLETDGEMEFGWLYNNNDWTLQEQQGLDTASFYTRYGWYTTMEAEYDWNAWLASFEIYQEMFTNPQMQEDVAQLIAYITLAQETHRVEFLREVYYIVHDMDYFLFRYGVVDYAQYVADLSLQTTYYGALSLWQEEYGLRARVTLETLPALTTPTSESQSLYEVEQGALSSLLEEQWGYRSTYPESTAGAFVYTDLDADGSRELWLFYENGATSEALVVEETAQGTYLFLGAFNALPALAQLENAIALYQNTDGTAQFVCTYTWADEVVALTDTWSMHRISLEDDVLCITQLRAYTKNYVQGKQYLLKPSGQSALAPVTQAVFEAEATLPAAGGEVLALQSLQNWRAVPSVL
ncbi:MAG: M56 family metallopeptidase [Faecalibacterium sp.]